MKKGIVICEYCNGEGFIDHWEEGYNNRTSCLACFEAGHLPYEVVRNQEIDHFVDFLTVSKIDNERVNSFQEDLENIMFAYDYPEDQVSLFRNEIYDKLIEMDSNNSDSVDFLLTWHRKMNLELEQSK